MRVGEGGGDYVPSYVRNAPLARAMVIGETHACLVTTPALSEVWCWGNNSQGTLGVGNARNPLPDPTRVQNFSPNPPLRLVAGYRSTYSLSPQGIVGWGDNADGALGTANPNPVVPMPSLVIADRRQDSISARGRGMCVSQSESIFCVGENRGLRFGPLSPNGAVVRTISVLPVNFLADSIFLADSYSCALHQQGVKCWGENRASGVLGVPPQVGDPAVVLDPRSVEFPVAGTRVVNLALGTDFVLALTSTGTVYCFICL